MRTLMCVPAIVGLASSSAGLAGVTYHTQARQVSVNAAGNIASATAPDFGPFNQTVTQNNLSAMVSDCTASQNSQLLATGISASGSVVADDGNSGFSGSARSQLDVTFTLGQPSAYRIFGNWTTDYVALGQLSAPTSTTVQLDGVFASTFTFPPQGQFAQASFDQSGVLAAGNYHFVIDFNWTNGNFTTNIGPAHASYNVTLNVPGPSGAAAAGLALAGVAARRRRRV